MARNLSGGPYLGVSFGFAAIPLNTGSRMPRIRLAWFVAAALVVAASNTVSAQVLDSTLIAGLKWRTVGPANFQGRLSDIAGIPGPSKTLFVAAAAGGVWKTTNNGLTWRPVFDDKRVASLGMLAIAPSDTQQVWI